MSNAERAGFSPARLAILDRFIKEGYVETGLLPGTLIQVWRHGELAHAAMAGMMDAERGLAMREDTIFRIYSMTKPVIGVALLALVEEGRISLDEEVAAYIPAWKDLRVWTGGELDSFTTAPARRPMTVLDLATHTAGLGGWTDGPVVRAYHERRIGDANTEGGLETFVDQLADLPLAYSPGESWDYSDATTALGYIIQKVAGEPLGEFLHRRIFGPLGMPDTAFFCPPEKASRLAAQYGNGDDGRATPFADTHDFLSPPKLESGNGGLVSTTADYMRFSRMLLGRGALDGVQIVGPKSVELMRTNMLPGNQDSVELATRGAYDNWLFEGVGHSICCGTTTSIARRRMPCSAGDIFWGGAANSYVLVDPSEDLAIVFMAQRMAAPFFFTLQRLIFTMVYSALTQLDA
jgi:CubicO group peptidase (beta-lactamase class C family)